MLVTVFTSCDGDSFKVSGNLASLNGNQVRIVFLGDSGVVDEMVAVDKKGHFSFKGQASMPTLVSILNTDGNQLVTLVANNGEHIKVKGDASKAMGIKVKGSKVNEDWQLFRNEHNAFYTDPNPNRLDAAIEKYVREHPADLLSTVLLMADYSDYSDYGKMNKMLESINSKARPALLTQTFLGNPMGHNNVNVPRMMDVKLVKHQGDFEEIKLTDRMTLISLWANPQTSRETLIQKLNAAVQESSVPFQVVDVLAEADTIHWHQAIANDPKEWNHYWAPGGPLEQSIQLLGISSLPWFAVTDSTGLVTYSGPDIDKAIKAAALYP